MKNLLRNSDALTLVELIISTAVVGIVMLGVMSTDIALRTQTDLSNKGAMAALNASSILTHIMHTAFLATGNTVDPGIVIGVPPNTFCIRTSMVPTWVCYTNTGTNLYTCQGGGLMNCTAANTDLGALYSDANSVTNAALPLPAGNNSSVVAVFDYSNAVGSSVVNFSATVVVPDTSAANGQRAMTDSVSPSSYSF